MERCKIQSYEFDKLLIQPGYLFGNGYKIVVASNFSQNYLSTLDVKVFIENFSSIFKRGRAKQIAEFFELIENVKFVRELLNNTIDYTYESYKENNKLYLRILKNLGRGDRISRGYFHSSLFYWQL